MSDGTKTLYERLGGYNAIAAVASDLLARLRADPQLGRFWAHRGEDGVMREKQLLIDFLCASAGGPMAKSKKSEPLIFQRIGLPKVPPPPTNGHRNPAGPKGTTR
jgi:truncated hemoglobin YjbI